MTVWVEMLEDEIEEAEETAKESHEQAMNSYGAGHDRGYVEGLKMALVLAAEVN